MQNSAAFPLQNLQLQQNPNQPNLPNFNQQDIINQEHQGNMDQSKLQQAGILLQNLANSGERNAQQGTCGSQIFQEVRNRRQVPDEVCPRRGVNKCVSLQAGQELNERKNAKRQTEQVKQAAGPGSGFNSSLKSSIDAVEIDDKVEGIHEQAKGQSLISDVDVKLLNGKKHKPGYHAKFSKRLDRPAMLKDTNKSKDSNIKHLRGESVQISFNIKNNIPPKLHLEPLNSPNLQINGQQRPVTCMSEGYQRNRGGQISHLVDNAPSSLHLSPLARQQACCLYSCFNPFVMSENQFEIPPALFLNLICHHVNMPDKHAIVVLALIDRFCNKVVDLNYQGDRFYKRLPNERRLQDTGNDIPEIKHCCSQMTINPQTIHKLILTSALVTQKFYSDIFYSNNFFTNRCGFIEVQELNRLEEIFLDVIDWNLTVDFEEYETYDNGLRQFFEAPLQPETIRIIEENHEAYNNLVQNQNQQIFNQEFEQWSHQSAQRLQMLERIIQQQQQQGQNQMMQNLPIDNNNNTGETSELPQNNQNLQLLQDLVDNGGVMNQGAGVNLGQNAQMGANLGGIGALPADFAQQHAGIPGANQDASQLNMHLLNIAIACEMQRQQSLNQQISILASLLQQLQMHEQQQQQNNGNQGPPQP